MTTITYKQIFFVESIIDTYAKGFFLNVYFQIKII